MTTLGPRVASLVVRWGALSTRERALLVAAGVGTVALCLGLGVHAAVDDLATRRARIIGRERELAQVRRLATRLRREHATPAAPVDGPSFVTRLETAAADTVGRERIASMTPAGAAEAGERMALRITGASLDEVVRLLHALEGDPPPLAITRLELRKHPDDPGRFDATVEVARPDTPTEP